MQFSEHLEFVSFEPGLPSGLDDLPGMSQVFIEMRDRRDGALYRVVGERDPETEPASDPSPFLVTTWSWHRSLDLERPPVPEKDQPTPVQVLREGLRYAAANSQPTRWDEGPTSEALSLVARWYRAGLLLGVGPTALVAEKLEIPQRRAEDWVHRTRAAGLLG